MSSPTGATRLFPIIGDPIKYVESPTRLTYTLHERDHDGICIPMQVSGDDLYPVMTGLAASQNVDGILVTMPHKFTAFGYCTTSSERAKMLKVVSVIRRNPDGSWHGDMLDGLAFVKAQIDHGAQPDGARALLLGAGGSVPVGQPVEDSMEAILSATRRHSVALAANAFTSAPGSAAVAEPNLTSGAVRP